MKLPSPYICDECGTQKKESNHWWVLLSYLYEAPEIPAFVLLPWESVTDDRLVTRKRHRRRPCTGRNPGGKRIQEHLCSESCATKALSKWMASLQTMAKNSQEAFCVCGHNRSHHIYPVTEGSVTSVGHCFCGCPNFQSANAGKPQPANDSPEERQTISDQRLKKVLDL